MFSQAQQPHIGQSWNQQGITCTPRPPRCSYHYFSCMQRVRDYAAAGNGDSHARAMCYSAIASGTTASRERLNATLTLTSGTRLANSFDAVCCIEAPCNRPPSSVLDSHWLLHMQQALQALMHSLKQHCLTLHQGDSTVQLGARLPF